MTIQADKFVFVHIPKTGGTWVRETLKRHGPKEWNMRITAAHCAIETLDPGDRTVFAVVRNPWDWYVSRYFFWGTHWLDKTGGYSRPRALWTDLERHWDDVFRKEPPNPAGFRRVTAEQVRAGDTLSATQERFLGARDLWMPCRFEKLRTDVAALLARIHGPLPEPLSRALLDRPAEMRSRHRPYREYYQPGLRDLIGEADRVYMMTYGYSF